MREAVRHTSEMAQRADREIIGPHLTQFRLSLEHPEWRHAPRRGPDGKFTHNPELLDDAILTVEGGIAGVNALAIYMRKYLRALHILTTKTNKSRFLLAGVFLRDCSNTLNLMSETVSAPDEGKSVPDDLLKRAGSLARLREVPESAYGRSVGEVDYDAGPVNFPPRTKIVYVKLDTLEELESVGGEGMSKLAHELRSPLTAFTGRHQLMERKARRNAATRLGKNPKEITIDELEEGDFATPEIASDLRQLDASFQDIRITIREDVLEVLTDTHPKEDLNAEDFREILDRVLKAKTGLPPETIGETRFIVNAEGEQWLEGLKHKLEDKNAGSPPIGWNAESGEFVKATDPQDQQLIEEINSLLTNYEHAKQEGGNESRSIVSPQLLQQMPVVWALKKMRTFARNALQNVLKAFGIRQGVEDTVDHTNHRVTPTVKITAGSMIELGVEDTGIGLPIGFQIEQGNTSWEGDRTVGTGVGLFGQRAELNKHYNGDLELRPNSQGGAILVAILPLKRPEKNSAQ